MAVNKYFKILVQNLPKDDPRYIKWRKSLKNRPTPWNKGKTKETHASLRKTSLTMKRMKLDNFKKWRDKMIGDGKIISNHPPLTRSSDLAYLIGLVLGDGNIYKHPRVEKLTITLGTDKPNLIKYSVPIIKNVFNKNPTIYKQKNSNCVHIYLYQKQISSRLGVLSGNRRHAKNYIPKWIWRSKKYLIACLRGLYEAEGSLCIHKPTYTYNFTFNNLNPCLLKEVTKALLSFNLHPEIRTYAIRLRRKKEVKYFKKLISFRKYSAG
ncbi:MAG: hypothetical protein ABIJ43_02545 [Candidatus Beckwithbacteria bacterium]|nr:hypothetical protein [Patescibacteria group bacterium]